jgi:ABC-type multidrug transport system ATPase subunit
VKIVLNDIGKKYNNHWLYKNINFIIEQNDSVAITGYNGSGKSTLIKMLSGYLIPTKGTINWDNDGKSVLPDDLYKFYSFCAPYTDLPEEFTLIEVLNWYFSFKPLFKVSKIEELVVIGRFQKDELKQVAQFSSGMKQRLKLLLALYTDCPLMLLDEPTANLDETNTAWYLETIKEVINLKTILIASNNSYEYSFCTKKIQLGDYIE